MLNNRKKNGAKILSFLTLTLVFCSCNNEKKTNSDLTPQQSTVEKKPISFDTIIIDHEIDNAARDKYESQFKNLSSKTLADSLKGMALYEGKTRFVNPNILYPNLLEDPIYHKINIPRTIYSKIFPEEEIKINRVRFTNPKIDQDKKQVTIEKGTKVTEERKYPFLYSIVEKENYLQLYFTNQGKYSPRIDLVTVSKADLSSIDKMNIFNSFHDVGDVDKTNTVINQDFNEFVKTEIHNNRSNYEQIDTIVTSYKISGQGKIIEIK